MLTKHLILLAEQQENEMHARINETVKKRDKSKEDYTEWKNACAIWHNSKLPTSFLWESSSRDKITIGNEEYINDAILFLEVDPWFFRSGYLKEELIQCLKKAPLTEDDKIRLRQVIINIVRGKNRREFKNYCSLAKYIWNEELNEKITLECKTSLENQNKAKYLLEYIQKNTKK